MRLAVVIGCGLAVLPEAGRAASYYVTPFTIAGASNVSIAAVNDFGVAVGSDVASVAPYGGAGFVGRPGKTVTLPTMGGPIYSFVPVPTAIDDAGTVLVAVGQLGEVFGYTWQGGAYRNQFLLNYGYATLFPPYLGSAGHISYNARIGDGLFSACAGLAGMATCLSPFGGFPEIASTNWRSEIAGQYEASVGGKVSNAVFAGNVTKIVKLLPPGATASYGGWLNDLGQVAGSYADKTGGSHGFVYSKGSYTSFDMPGPPTKMHVQGIDMSGRVVGVYTIEGRQYAFVYTHGAVVPIGKFEASATVNVTISHFGRAIGISAMRTDQIINSFLVRCKDTANSC